MLESLLLCSYGYIIPVLLAFASVFRCTVASFIYVFLFLAVAFFPLSVIRPVSRKHSCCVLLLIMIWSMLIILTELSLAITLLLNDLPRTETSDRYIHSVIGFYWNDVNTLQYYQMIVPDTLIFLTSVLTLGICLRSLKNESHVLLTTSSRKITSKEDKEKETQPSEEIPQNPVDMKRLGNEIEIEREKRNIRTIIVTRASLVFEESNNRCWHGIILFVLCSLAGLLYPSIPTSVFLIGSLFCIVTLALGLPGHWLEKIVLSVLFPFTVAYLSYLYLSQFQFGSTTIASPWLSGSTQAGTWISGLFPLNQASSFIAEFLLLLSIIFVAASRLNSIRNTSAKKKFLNKSQTEQEKLPTQSIMNSQMQEAERNCARAFLPLSRFVHNTGWPISFVGYLFACIFTPSLLSGIILFVVMFASSLLSYKYLKKILPLLLLYSSSFVVAQVVYNLIITVSGENFINSDSMLLDLGFIVYDSYFAYIGIQCIPIFSLASFIKFGREYKEINEKLEIHGNDLKQRLTSSVAINNSLEETKEMINNDIHGGCEAEFTNAKRSMLKHKISCYMNNSASLFKYCASLAWHIFLKNSYYITLIALLLCSLIEANLFNFGYLCFFVLFLLSRRIAMMSWLLLVLYTETVIMITFLWQLSWTNGLDETIAAQWFGLQHYEDLINGLFVPLLIFIFSIVQLGLIRVFEAQLKAEGKNLRGANVYSFTADDLPLGRRSQMLFNSFDYWIDYSSLWICYIAMFVVSMIGHYDLFSMFYLILFYVCMIIHELSESKARVFVSFCWPLVVLSSGAILIAVYFFQFDSVSNWIISVYPESLNEYLTLSDIGLSFTGSPAEIYISLLGTSTIFFLSVLQLRSFVLLRKNENVALQSSREGYEAIPEDKDHPEKTFTKGETKLLSDIPVVFKTKEFAKRFFVLHAEKVSLILAYSAVLVSVSLLDDILVIITVAGLLLPGALNSIGGLTILFCQFLTLSSYVCQFTGFLAFIQEYAFHNNEKLMNEWLQWLGISMPDENLFAQTLLYNLLILSLIIERSASIWASHTRLISENNEKCLLFEVTKEEMEVARRKFKLDEDRPLITRENLNFLSRFVLYYISNFYRYHGIYFFTISLLVTLFLRYNIWSIFEILIVVVCLVKPRQIFKLSGLLTVLLSCLLIFQYTTYLGPSPNFEAPPWSSLDATEQSWFTLGASYSIVITFSDFVTLLLLSYIYKSYHIKVQHPAESIHDFSPIPAGNHLEASTNLQNTTNTSVSTHELDVILDAKLLERDRSFHINPAEKLRDTQIDLSDDPVQLSDAMKSLEGPLNQEYRNTETLKKEGGDTVFRIQSWRGRVIYLTLRYSIHMILFFMFIAATAKANLMSCGYLIFASFFLYNDSLLYRYKNTLWRWGRIYNFMVMVIIVIYQFPYFPACIPACTTNCPECDPYALQMIIGLVKFDAPRHVFSSGGILFDMVIFLLMAVQSGIFETLLFARVAHHVTVERENAIYYAKLKYLLFLKSEEQAIKAMNEEKENREARLLKIHNYRKKKQYLVASETKIESQRIVKTVSEASNIVVLGVPEKNDREEENDTDLPRSFDNRRLSSIILPKTNEEVDKEIGTLYSTIEDFLDENFEENSETASTASLTSSDKKTKTDVLRDMKQNCIEYCQKAYEFTFQLFSKYLYSQTFQRPDETQTKYQTILKGIYYYCLNKSHVLCYLAFIFNNFVFANLLSMMFPIFAFAYALLESPVPNRKFWRFSIAYTYVVIGLKFLFQFSVFCVCYTSGDLYFWCVEPFCSSSSYPMCSTSYKDPQVILGDLPELFGIVKFSVFFALGIGMDLIVLITLLVHRNNLKSNGLWVYLTQRRDEIFQRYVDQQAEKDRAIEKQKEIKRKKKILLAEWKKGRKKIGKTGISLSVPVDDAAVPELVDVIPADDVNVIGSLDGDTDLQNEDQRVDPVDSIIFGIDAPVEVSAEEKSIIHNLDDMESDEPSIRVENESKCENIESGSVESIVDDDNDTSVDEHLVEMKEEQEAPSQWQQMKSATNFYFYSLFRHKATAKDYYVPMVSIECLAFFYMIICQNAFSYNPPDDGYSFLLLESQIPTSFFFILLIQFFLIVIDRIIYLFRSVLMKLIVQYVTLVYYTILLFFVLPEGQGKQFNQIWVLIIFYGIQCIYWWISALQISEGYPVNIQKRWITQSYNSLHSTLFTVYLAIPFLFELRSLLDWSVFDTTLSFFQWMKLEDIYRNLYQIKCSQVSEIGSDWYEKQSFWTKNVLGVLVFIVLIIILWFPLFLLSSANPANQPNVVIGTTFDISVSGFSPFYHIAQDQNIYAATNDQFDTIRRNFDTVQGSDAPDTQILDLHLYSNQVWVMTPPSLHNLQRTLLNTSQEVTMQLEYSFRREEPPGSQVLFGRYDIQLENELREKLADMIVGVNQTEALILPKMIPRLFQLPLSGSIETPDNSSNNLDIVLALNRTIYRMEVQSDINGEIQEIDVLLPYWYLTNQNIHQTYVDDSDESIHLHPQLVIVSAEAPSFFSSFAATGIIGLYITIVLAVGRFLRMSVSDLQYNIVFEDMPEPIDLITLCEDIFVARETGDLHLERDLYNEIIQLYRSPESLIAVTRPKQTPDTA